MLICVLEKLFIVPSLSLLPHSGTSTIDISYIMYEDRVCNCGLSKKKNCVAVSYFVPQLLLERNY